MTTQPLTPAFLCRVHALIHCLVRNPLGPIYVRHIRLDIRHQEVGQVLIQTYDERMLWIGFQEGTWFGFGG